MKQALMVIDVQPVFLSGADFRTIDGDDLVVLSRSGDARAKTAHDGNLITFHRVRDFRGLVY